MARTIVGVLRGGTSSEYDLSLKTGAAMLNALPEEKYEARDILIDKQGMWHLRGIPIEPARALAQVDVALNALHGGVGEDGSVQRILQRAGIPFAGSRALSAGIAHNKIRAREVLKGAHIPMPRAVSFNVNNAMTTRDMAQVVFSQFGPPYMVKPLSEGSSRGLRYVATIVELPNALADALDEFGAALVEEYLLGAHGTMVIVEHFRREPLYAFPPSHIHIRNEMRYHDPLAGLPTRHIVPSRLPHDIKISMAAIARRAHEALKLAHYSDADFVIARRGAMFLEVNPSPGLHEHSALPHMLEAVGSTVRELVEHLILLARRGI